uniref:Uncharacterized protein n=1 Tax=Parascaris univalens TaxID=6257 RepID=A0A915BEL1_PARUN
MFPDSFIQSYLRLNSTFKQIFYSKQRKKMDPTIKFGAITRLLLSAHERPRFQHIRKEGVCLQKLSILLKRESSLERNTVQQRRRMRTSF